MTNASLDSLTDVMLSTVFTLLTVQGNQLVVEKYLHTLHPKHSPEEPAVLRACQESQLICSYSLCNARVALASLSTSKLVAEARTSGGQQSPMGLPILTLKTPPPGEGLPFPGWQHHSTRGSPLEPARDHQILPEITGHHWRPPESDADHQRPLETDGDERTPLEINTLR